MWFKPNVRARAVQIQNVALTNSIDSCWLKMRNDGFNFWASNAWNCAHASQKAFEADRFAQKITSKKVRIHMILCLHRTCNRCMNGSWKTQLHHPRQKCSSKCSFRRYPHFDDILSILQSAHLDHFVHYFSLPPHTPNYTPELYHILNKEWDENLFLYGAWAERTATGVEIKTQSFLKMQALRQKGRVIRYWPASVDQN